MLDRQKVIIALEEKRPHFEGYAGDLRSQRSVVEARLAKLQEYTYQSLSNYLDSLGDSPKGALANSSRVSGVTGTTRSMRSRNGPDTRF